MDESIKISSVFKDDNLTDDILCLKNGHSLGTSSLSSVIAGRFSLLVVIVMRDESNIITLFVEAVKSSNSNRMSHRMVSMFGI